MKAFAFTFALICVTGCATKTRLGSLIPAHANSQITTGEVVLLDFEPAPVAPGSKLAPIVAGAAMAVFDVGVKFIQSELKREALLYEASFSQKVGLSSKDIREGTNTLVLTRWVDSGATTQTTSPSDNGATMQWITSFGRLHQQDLQGKKLVYLLQVDLVAEKAIGPYKLCPRQMYLWQSKTKVVGIGAKDAYRFWRWLGALMLKTDSKLRHSVDISVSALSKTTNNAPMMVQIPPVGNLIPEREFDLNKPSFIDFHGQPSLPIDLPAYTSTANRSEFTIELTVKESDASNVPQKIGEVNDFIDKNKDSWRSKLENKLK